MEVTTLRMPEELSEFITTFAKKKGITRNALIIQIFWEWKKKKIQEDFAIRPRTTESSHNEI